MFRNPWISSYHVNHEQPCGQELGSTARPKLCSSASLPTEALSFQSDFSLEEKTALVKSVSDTDAKLLFVLPKVSELKKYFEGPVPEGLGMNRKERIARRLEGHGERCSACAGARWFGSQQDAGGGLPAVHPCLRPL
ncbi:hypothetical protein CgunFtcFv8_023805 [Champsocephalus gunnari]|uniref:Uncharacterized protein n=1 Tax=Champsocephalus gunnari TaxID=52237 RepID=A0AAN8HKQ1_CHAGU|nr:hypothetical protein CgunFtcFv8_023805 [Champsocephalus gunnari]